MPPVVHVLPAFCELAKTRLLAPPPLTYLPDWLTATMVFPNAKESGSSWVLCWTSPLVFVYGSLLIGCERTVSAAPAETRSRPAATATAAAHVLAPLNPRSPT